MHKPCDSQGDTHTQLVPALNRLSLHLRTHKSTTQNAALRSGSVSKQQHYCYSETIPQCLHLLRRLPPSAVIGQRHRLAAVMTHSGTLTDRLACRTCGAVCPPPEGGKGDKSENVVWFIHTSGRFLMIWP